MQYNTTNEILMRRSRASGTKSETRPHATEPSLGLAGALSSALGKTSAISWRRETKPNRPLSLALLLDTEWCSHE